MRILGISAFYHDSAAALVEDGRIVAAAQEERFSREKHDSSFPAAAINYCLTQAGAPLRDIDVVAFYEKPFLKFERLLETYIAFVPSGFQSFSKAMPLWLRQKLFQKDALIRLLQAIDPAFAGRERLLFAEHHQSHAASAFYPSPFSEAAVLTIDGVGEWATTAFAIGRDNHLDILEEMHFPHSLGLFYSAFTYYLGFKVNSGEYKIMGLAPYGEPKYAQLIFDRLIDLKDDGTFRLNLDYFDYCAGLRMTNRSFDELFGAPARRPDQRLTQREMDLAASAQTVLEEIVHRMTRSLAAESGQRNLCLAGGVALNCVANGKILRDGRFERIWIQPAAGDAGGALGAALCAYHRFNEQPRRIDNTRDGMSGALLGPSFPQREIEERLYAAGANFDVLSGPTLIDVSAESLAAGRALGWFQGRMEFGPRALGSRSILGDPRAPTMQSTLNLKIKYRESFRPFAPAVLREKVADWFELDEESPYMLLVADVAAHRRLAVAEGEELLFGIEKLKVPRSEIPAVTHVDYSARIQTVDRETNPLYYALLSAFEQRTGCPVLVNTSFNVRGEPIVHTPEDAFRCFMGSEIDSLAIGNCFLRKEAQNPSLKLDYKNAFAPD